MLTYLLLNTAFLVAVLVTLKLLKIPIAKRWYVALVPLAILTAVFDPLLIHFEVFGYDSDKILGLRWFGAPVEDFIYSLLAAILAPTLWHYLHKRAEHE